MAVSTARRVSNDPRFSEAAPVWGESAARRQDVDPQPRSAKFQADSFDARALDAAVRLPGKFGFRLANGLPSYDYAAIQGQPAFRSEGFLDGVVAPRTILGQLQALPSEPRWKLFKPVLPGKLITSVQMAMRSFLRWPVVPAATQDPMPESFEMRLQPISFAPFSPGMACLEERLHRTDRIGFSPP